MDLISRRRFVGAAVAAALGSFVSPRVLGADHDRPSPIVKPLGFTDIFDVKDPAFGAKGDGVTDDGAAINNAINAAAAHGGGVVVFDSTKTYAVDPGANRIRIKSGVHLDLRGATIQRIGANYAQNLIANYSYTQPAADFNISVMNGTIKGNGTNVVGTQAHGAGGHDISFYGVDGFVLDNLKLDVANGDCLHWREAHNGLIHKIRGGSFGRNLFSPTSGLNNRITDCDFAFTGLAGASPGGCIDVENNSATEISKTYWSNVRANSITFIDFWTTAGQFFAHEAQFDNCIFVGGSPRTFRINATNSVTAQHFVIEDTCRIGITVNTANALQIGNVANVRCNAHLSNDSGSAGNSVGIATLAATDSLIFKGSMGAGRYAFNYGIAALSHPLTNSLFVGVNLGHVILKASSAANDFTDCAIANLTIDGVGSMNNRFRSSTRITGTKTFSNGARSSGNLLEKE